MVQGISVSDAKNVGYRDVIIEDPIEISGTTSANLNNHVRIEGQVYFSDRFNSVSVDGISGGLGGNSCFGELGSLGNVGNTEINLPSILTTTSTLTCVNNGTGNYRVNPLSSESILPIGTSGQSIETTQKGAKIKLVRFPDGNFFITEIVGLWTAV